jgi:uncharacterized protein (DUF58 family)
LLSRSLRTAVVALVGAIAMAIAARWFLFRGEAVISSVLVMLAFLLCCGVIYLCAPFVARSLPWRRLRVPLQFRLTRQGLIFVAAVFAVATAALVSSNNLLYLVLSCMLGAMVVSGLVSRLGLAGLQLHISFPRHVFARQRALAKVSVRNLKLWMPSFSIWVGAPGAPLKGTDVVMEHFYCPMITAGSSAVGSLPTAFAHRGTYQHRAVWLRSRFPLAFVERRTRLDLGREVLVYPSVEASPEVEHIVSGVGSWLRGVAPGDSHDLYRIRPALAGESARLLDWKASARSGELMVREFSREDQRRLNIVFDRTLPVSEDAAERFESIVELCAAVVWRLHHMNAEICFSAEDTTILSSPNSGAVYQILRYLALVEAAPGNVRGRAADPLPQFSGDWSQLVFSARPREEWPAIQSSKGPYSFPQTL